MVLSPGRIVFVLAWLLLAFVFVLNMYLRGRFRAHIEALLCVVIIAASALAFLVWGWPFGLLTVVAWFPFTIALKPIARKVAHRTLGYRTGVDHYAAERDRQSLLSRRGDSLEQIMATADGRRQTDELQLARIAATPGVAAILREQSISTGDLSELLVTLRIAGLADLAWEILADPNELVRLIEFQRSGGGRDAMYEYVARVRDLR